jgi:integrase
MEAAPVKRRFRYIDDPIVIEDEAPRIPAKKVKLRVVDKPRVRDSESVISEIKALKVDDLDTGKKKTKKQKAKEIHVKGDKSRRKPALHLDLDLNASQRGERDPRDRIRNAHGIGIHVVNSSLK